ncbi:unnamed protein product [Ilex paraguariensis]|uniref:t-SNARE coiled-coil homology domain-containing protein n=1 Tax=Ilex paraguariensis TaxID=185542 RepID=A0ABC8UYR4_9AQUA
MWSFLTDTTTQAASNQRERQAMSTERLNQPSDRIKESRRTMLEREELGVSILEDLHQQRETLLHSHKKLNGVDDAIDKSKKILSAMSRRMTKNKWIVGSIIASTRVETLLNGVDDAIDKSKKILSAMSRRMTKNKWIVGSIIASTRNNYLLPPSFLPPLDSTAVTLSFTAPIPSRALSLSFK